MGVFIAHIFSTIYYTHPESKEIEQVQLYVILNSLFCKRFAFYHMCVFLTKITTLSRKEIFLNHRYGLRTRKTSFDDLKYMKEFLREKQTKDILRGNSAKSLQKYNQSLIPKKLQKFQLSQSKSLNISNRLPEMPNDESSPVQSDTSTETNAIEMNEFLVHLNLHLQMNLDYVFLSGIKEIINFFSSLEHFMEMTFGNKEIEIKIDMMRLVIRMTNASSFIDKLFMLDLMRMKYLEQWQTFSLFVQVLQAEINKSSGKKIRKRSE